MGSQPQNWKKRLAGELKNLRRLAVLGIGNELYMDDGAGVRLARELSCCGLPSGKLQAFEAGPAPENFTGSIRKQIPVMC